jgi:hypothetical protein
MAEAHHLDLPGQNYHVCKARLAFGFTNAYSVTWFIIDGHEPGSSPLFLT